MSVLASGEFWAFVGVMAGIYTLFTLGLQVQFGLAGLLNFGQVGFMEVEAFDDGQASERHRHGAQLEQDVCRH